jgi:hypothetical protein
VALPIARRAARLSLPLVGAFTVGAITYGGLYTFPALSVAFANEFGISRTLAVTPWTMFLVVTAVASPLLGRASSLRWGSGRWRCGSRARGVRRRRRPELHRADAQPDPRSIADRRADADRVSPPVAPQGGRLSGHDGSWRCDRGKVVIRRSG